MPESQSTSNVLTTDSSVSISCPVPASSSRLRASSTRRMPPSGANGCSTFSISGALTNCSGTT